MQKTERQQLILDLISIQPVGRQDTLAHLLGDKGFTVTQASVSRDLEELGIVKQNGRYALAAKPAGLSEFGQISINTAGDNLIVVRCKSGLASAAAVRIDAAGIPEVVGTIAGDDTIFVAVTDRDSQTKAIKKLNGVFERN